MTQTTKKPMPNIFKEQQTFSLSSNPNSSTEGIYILENKEPVECRNLQRAAIWYENSEDKWVGRTKINGLEINTGFLVVNYNLGEGAPLFFETNIFGGKEHYQTRCSTWDEAEIMHNKAINLAKEMKS